MRRFRLAAPVFVITAGIVAACSSGGPPVHHPSSHSATSASPRPGASSPALLNGVQLGQILDKAQPPSGWSSPKGSLGDEANSGTYLVSPPGPGKAYNICSALDSAVQASTFADWWSSSDATRHLTDRKSVV